MSAFIESAPTPPAEAPAPRVALREPDAALRMLLSEWLRGVGFEPVPCDAGASADVAIVIADVCTPRVGGAAYIAALRERFRGAKVLAISGYFMTAGSRAAARELGADALLAKPFSRRAFVEALQALA
jgi:CheY-like chemotaxis protein